MRRIIAKILIGVTIFLITILLFCFIILQNEQVKSYALRYATDQIHAKTGWEIEFNKIQGLLPLQLRGTGLKIHSPDNQDFSVESFHLVISPIDLFKGRINIHLADLEHIRITLPWNSDQIDHGQDVEALKEIKLPSIPFKINIHEFHLVDLDIGQTLPRLDVEGSFEYNPFKQKLFAQMNFREVLNPRTPTKFSLAINKENEKYKTIISLLEPSGGLLFSHFNLPPELSASTTINLSGTTSAWHTLINNKKGLEDIVGDFELRCCWNKNHSHKLATSGSFELLGDRSIQLTKIAAQLHREGLPESPLVQLEGHFHLDPMYAIIGSDFTMQAHDLSFSKFFLDNPIEGKAHAKFQVSGNYLNPKITLDLACDEVTIQGFTARHLHSFNEFHVANTGLEGSTRATFNLRDFPITLASSFSSNRQGIIKLPALTLSGPDTAISANIDYQLQENIAKGTIEVHAKDLSKIGAMLNQKGAGSLDILINLRPEYSLESSAFIQAAEMNLSGTKLSWNEIAIGDVSLKQTLAFPKDNFKSHIHFTAKEIKAFPFPNAEMTFSTEIERSKNVWPYEITIEGDGNTLFNLNSKGSWHTSLSDASFENFILRIESLQGAIADYALSLQQPISFSRSSEMIELSPISIQLGEGTFLSSIDYTPQHMLLHWDINRIPLQILQVINPQFLLKGTFNSEAKLYGHPSQLLGDIQFNFNEIKVDDTLLKMPVVEASFKMELQQDKLKAGGNIFGIGNKPITLIGEIPFSLSVEPLAAKMDPEKPLSAHVEMQGEVAPILQLMIADTTSITGQAMSTLDISGTLGNPQISGLIELKNGSFESLVSGAVFKNIYLRVQGEGHEMHIIEAKAEDGNEGTLMASGMMVLDPVQKFPFDFTFDFNKTTILHLDYARAVASGKLNWKGTMGNDLLSGDLIVDSAMIRIPEEVPAQMHALEVTYVNHPPDEKEPSYHRKKKTNPIALDIKLHIPKNGFLNGKNLASEWKGLIAITGTDDKPLLNGGLEVMQGKYQFNGKDFELHQGTITFAGDPANKSTLYVTADQETEGMKLEAILKGPIKNPKISFRSNPPMSQKEILSWILFNRGASEITSSENAQLSQSIITLSSGNSGPDLLGKIRRSFGIDRIDISSKDTNDSNEVSLRVGKYISRGIFLSVNKSINSEANQVAIEANISRNIKAQAEINDDAEGKMILKWQKDY